MIAPFTFDRAYVFTLEPDALWKVLDRTDQYPMWWRWLREFDTDGVSGLHEGMQARCVVRGPLPYSLRFAVRIESLTPGRLVETHVSGDLAGPARLELEPVDGGTSARLVWALEIVDPALRATTRTARPLMEWGHNFVVNRGVRAFRQRLSSGPPPARG